MESLNIPPKKFIPGTKTKAVFFISMVLVLVFYGFMLYKKRSFVKQHQNPKDLFGFDLDLNQKINLKDFDKKYILLNIFGTFCPICIEKFPKLEEIAKKYEKNLTVIALSIDDDPNNLKAFIDKQKPKIQVLWDKDKITHKLGIKGVPESFLFDQDLNELSHVVGKSDFGFLNFLLEAQNQ